MRELQTGVWHWEAPHPDWKPEVLATHGGPTDRAALERALS